MSKTNNLDHSLASNTLLGMMDKLGKLERYVTQYASREVTVQDSLGETGSRLLYDALSLRHDLSAMMNSNLVMHYVSHGATWYQFTPDRWLDLINQMAKLSDEQIETLDLGKDTNGVKCPKPKCAEKGTHTRWNSRDLRIEVLDIEQMTLDWVHNKLNVVR